MIVGSQPQGNQLLFNLCNGTAPTTLSARFHPPKPIVIEKIPIATTPPHSRGGPTSTSPHFTAISAESLSRAVEIAKRDLKKKRWESANAGRNRSRPQTKPTKIVHSHSYQEKQRKRQQRQHSPVLVMKERTEARPSQTKILQTEDVVVRSVGQKYKLKDLPARSMSPPTRDHPTTHEDRVLNEICRLRMEMTKCLQQMKSIKDQRELQPKGVKASMYAEDVEEDRKRRIRTEERAIRSARTIYMLKQQSNKLHSEIKKLDTKVKIDTKKGPLTSRLAALHRGVVCALQLLVRQMSDDESLQSVARDYRELAIIIRQLSICCAQLEITNGSSNAQEDLLDLIKDVAELNEIVEAEESRSTLARPCQSSDHQVHQQKKATCWNSEPISKSHRTPIEKVKVVLNEFGGDINAVKNITVDQRQAVLSCGIQKLLRSKAAKGALSPSGSKTKFLPKKRRLRSSCGHRGRSRRGVLLVHQNTGCVHGSSCSSSCTDIASDNREHYTRATISTHQKSVGPQDRRPALPTRVKILQPAVEAAGCHFAKPTFSKSQKEVSASQEQSRHSTPCSSPQLTPRRIKSQRAVTAVDPSWRRNMENDVRNRIEPVLKDGQIAVDINKVTDEIIGELMEDMALELRKRQADDHATHQAAVLHDAPSVGAILIRLRQMELEEDDIRRRWTNLTYGELKPKTGATVRDAPGSPLPVEIFAGANGTSQAYSGRQDSPENFDSVEPVVFTKPHLKSVLRQAEFQIDKRLVHKKGTVVSLPSEVLFNIRQQVRDYEAYLRRHVSDRVEHFDPWRVVEEIADDILESCLHDVCLELEDINNDIVDHVYRSEFSLVPNEGQTV